MKKTRIVLKLILPFVVGLLIVAIISIGGMYYLQKQFINKQALNTFHQVSSVLSNAIEKDTKLFEELITLIKKDPSTLMNYQNRDRDKLFLYLSKTYNSLNENYNISHFYIHDVNKSNFVRIHNRNAHSDIIKRNTLDKAAENNVLSSGIEFGIYHNFTLRVVSPWSENGNLIGFIEIGKDLENFTRQLSSALNADIIFTVNKNIVSEKDMKIWKEKLLKNNYHDSLRNYQIIDSTIQKLSPKLKELLNSNNNTENVEIKNFENKYHVNSEQFYDINNKEVGKLYVLVDTTTELGSLLKLILKISIVIVIISMLMAFYYSKYIKRIENRLNNAQAKIHELSITDGLTSLHNKRFFNENVPTQISRAIRNQKIISFLILDADNFKKYNDNYGHLQGDIALQKIALTIEENFKRINDTCYRVGGEEFAIVYENIDEKEGLVMAEQLCKKIQELNIDHLYNNDFKVLTVSIGVCTVLANKNTSLSELYKKADKALYKSKENGRNRVTLYS